MTENELRQFMIEAREHLELMESLLLKLESTQDSALHELVDNCLRAAHSLKGDAGFLGYTNIQKLAHAIETILGRYRLAPALPTQISEMIFQGRDRLASLIDDLDASHHAQISDLLNRLEAIGELPLVETTADHRFSIHLIHWPLSGFDSLASLIAAFNSPEIITSSLKVNAHNIETSLPSAFSTLEIVAKPSLVSLDWFKKLLEANSLSSISKVEPEVAQPVEAVIKSIQSVEQMVAPKPPTEVASVAKSTDEPASTNKPQSTGEAERLGSLRISVELLDRLMNLAGELTLVRNQSLVAFAEQDGARATILQRLDSVTSELQDTVMRTRMQPVSNLFGKFPRMVRDLAKQLNKQVELQSTGNEVELDKTVIELLSDPLTHLIRNCVDHGLELPDERAQMGKPKSGKILLSATPSDGQVLIEVCDDGRGIDPAKIKAKALSLRLRTEAELERMSEQEILSLILLPGFSTAKTVTDVSGRGVGMDVVKTNIEAIEGTLTIQSKKGTGTSMLLRVPLTLAIIPSVIVGVKGELYALPQRDLEELIYIYKDSEYKIETGFDCEVMPLRGTLLPIVRLADVLAEVKPFTPQIKMDLMRSIKQRVRTEIDYEYVLVVRSQGKRFGLVVDTVGTTEEIVIKPMHPAAKPVSIFGGATLMGDGRVALILSTDGILNHARCPGVEASNNQAAQLRDPDEVHRVLLFEYGPQEQLALPLIQIARIEAIKSASIERIGSREFVTLQGVATEVVRLDHCMNVSVPEMPKDVQLLIPKFMPKPIGILITRVIDIKALSIELQKAGEDQAGILGTCEMENRLSIFIDINHIRRCVYGETSYINKSSDAASRASTANTTNADVIQTHQASVEVTPYILLVDDTPFFREIVRRYLEEIGYRIDTAKDGEHGLQKLKEQQFDMVVSDIEMPVLDGFGFCKKAREEGYTIPFIALTSLAKSDYEARAKSCGFNAFEEKLDRDRLVSVVQNTLASAGLRGAI
jgi:two-component system, chemotaxis family, sensor kinase CheA